jgi:hypothetical protein
MQGFTQVNTIAIEEFEIHRQRQLAPPLFVLDLRIGD